MFSKNQQLSINGYFKMLNDKFLELYKLINKDGTNEPITVDKGDTKMALGFTEDGGLFFNYIFEKRGDCYFFSFINDNDNKQVYFSSDRCIFVFLDEGEIVNLCIDNLGLLLKREKLLEVFNCSIESYKTPIQNMINTFASEFNVSAPEIDKFAIPGFTLKEEPTKEEITTILAAAIRCNGIIRLGYDHAGCANHIGRSEYEVDATADKDHIDDFCENGYITSDGRFVKNEEAWRIALKNDLIDENVQSFTKNSEDFYRACKKYFDLMGARKAIKERLKRISYQQSYWQHNPQKVLKTGNSSDGTN